MKPEILEGAIKFIKENPGLTENKLVLYMEQEGLSSRLTTLKVVKHLIQNRSIQDRKKGNSFHRLYFNDRSQFNLINKRINEIENIADRLVAILRKVFPEFDKYDLKSMDQRLKAQFKSIIEFTHDFMNSANIIIRYLLYEINNTVNSDDDSQILYTKITKLLLKVNDQEYVRPLTFDIIQLTSIIISLSALKGIWKRMKQDHTYNVLDLDISLVESLMKELANFKRELDSRNSAT